MTRGERNCNPLNIRRVASTTWRGQREKQEDREFVQFRSHLWGLRAAFCILDTYRQKYKAVCVADIIRRWAPPSENNTERYIKNVCARMRVGGNERLTEDRLPALVAAMSVVESDMYLSDDLLQRAFELWKTLKKK